MDYWGMPRVRTNIHQHVIGIDVANCWAGIPGDGNDKMSVTYSYDLAAYIVKLLDLDEWPEFSVFAGDDVTYNELLKLAEEARGMYFEHLRRNLTNLTRQKIRGYLRQCRED